MKRNKTAVLILVVVFSAIDVPHRVIRADVIDVFLDWKLGQSWTVQVQRYQMEAAEPILMKPSYWDYNVSDQCIVDGEPSWVLTISEHERNHIIGRLYICKQDYQLLRLERYDSERVNTLDYVTESNGPAAVFSDGFLPPIDFPVFHQSESAMTYEYVPVIDESWGFPLQVTQIIDERADDLEIRMIHDNSEVIQHWQSGNPWWTRSELPGVFIAETVSFTEPPPTVGPLSYAETMSLERNLNPPAGRWWPLEGKATKTPWSMENDSVNILSLPNPVGQTESTPWSGYWWPAREYDEDPDKNTYAPGGCLEKYDEYYKHRNGSYPSPYKAQVWEFERFRFDVTPPYTSALTTLDPMDEDIRENCYFDDWVIKIDNSRQINITMTSTFDNYLLLHRWENQRWETIAHSDDAQGTNANISLTIEPGTYRIIATSYSQWIVGSYTLSTNLNLRSSKAGWTGHCNGWCSASILHEEPLQPRTLNGIRFDVGDLKGLLTEAYFDCRSSSLCGHRYGSNYFGLTEINPGDPAPYHFHRSIVQYIGIYHRAVVFDVYRYEAVWNYPAYRYEMTTQQDPVISNRRHVTCRVWFADDNVYAGFHGTKVFGPLTYRYYLTVDSSDNPTLGPNDWEGDPSDRSNPDFIWLPEGPTPYTGSERDHNPMLDWNIIQKIVGAPLTEAVDNKALPFSTGGSAKWFRQTNVSYNGGDAAQSGKIIADQQSWMRTTVEVPEDGYLIVEFYWKVSSEADGDYLEFYYDYWRQVRISGSEDWERVRYRLTQAGSHNLEWRYVKNSSGSAGDDCGWVDSMKVFRYTQ